LAADRRLLAVGEALYLRYLAIEHGPYRSLPRWARQLAVHHLRLVIVLYDHAVFGWIALAAALLNLLRPSIVLMSIAIAAAGFAWCCTMLAWPGWRRRCDPQPGAAAPAIE